MKKYAKMSATKEVIKKLESNEINKVQENYIEALKQAGFYSKYEDKEKKK